MDKRRQWSELIHGLGVFSSEGKRAIYKPLLTLVILARAQRNKENRLYFEEIEHDLNRLIRQFSTTTKPNCNYPFWYLRNDGYWEVHTELGDAATRTGKANEPSAKGLRDARAYGKVPDKLWDELLQNEGLIAELGTKLIEDYWPSSMHEDVASAVGIVLGSAGSPGSKRDPYFRDIVLRAYNFQCAVCGFDGRISNELFGIEAAHIQARSAKTGNGPDIIQNGLSLCALHHKAFDYGAIGLDARLRLKVSSRVSGNDVVSEQLRKYANVSLLAKPYKEAEWPTKDYIDWHSQYVFRSPQL